MNENTLLSDLTRNLGEYGANSVEEFTICEYSSFDGSLVSFEGGLLDRFGITVPGSLSELPSVAASWPFSAECREQAMRFVSGLAAAGRDGQPALTELEVCFVSRDGSENWVGISSIPLLYEDVRVTGLVFSCADHGKHKLLQLIDQADNDPLTGALNRGALKKAVDRMTATGESFALVMMDVDGFKKLNDTLGHIAGDSVLIDIVKKLRCGLRREDIIGRLGGDEFVVCLRNVSDTGVIDRLAQHICVLAQQELPGAILTSASLGIALSPRDGVAFDELYSKADLALYNTKQRGGDGFTVYRPEIGANRRDKDGASSVSRPAAPIFDYSALMHYDTVSRSFYYPEIIEELFSFHNERRPLWDIFLDEEIASLDSSVRLHSVIDEIAASDSAEARFEQFFLRSSGGIWRWYRMGFVRGAGDSRILMTLTDINEEIVTNRRFRHMAEYDELTGLLTRNAFNRFVQLTMLKDREGIAAGEYAVVYCDILRFKAINDMFGIAEGDRLLTYIADVISNHAGTGSAASRISSDRFVLFLHKHGSDLLAFVDAYLAAVAEYELAFEVVSNVGIYVTCAEELTVDAMIDRAILAQSAIKGSYAVRRRFYDEALRSEMLSENEIVGVMTTALSDGQFQVYYQPQYNHFSGMLVGAEALVRWSHSERGLLSPSSFIPIFEKNGFISKLDFYVFGKVCGFQRSCLDSGIKPVPISVNLTRYDIFEHGFIERLEDTRRKYDVPVELLRIEITETAVVGSNKHVSEIIDKLHEYGYIVEMDDFGSGYSSLNVLKDINMDILKLDMKFLTDDIGGNRGGTILGSVINMAKWLHLPVIAEGVETARQADYLRSVGCDYMQGFLYSKPIVENEYRELLRYSATSSTSPQLNLIDTLDAGEFWDPDSLDTLIFSSYVGGAIIFNYRAGQTEVLRVNKKYLKEVGGCVTESDIIRTDPLMLFDSENLRIYTDAVERAIATGEEIECEYWRSFGAGCPPVCLRGCLHIIGRSKDNYIVYETIRNITAEKQAVNELRHREKVFRTASEQANIYYWEYDVDTREMFPCSRCIRDLGLPSVLADYPDSAIEMGIFPPEAAEVYRSMHKNIELGIAEQEVDIPMTAERLPFRVRYTTEFDQSGRPVKAYGSATKL